MRRLREFLPAALLPAAAAATLAVAPLAAAGDGVPAAKRLPPITYGFVSIPDVAVFKERFGETTAAGLLEDPAFAEVRRILAEQLDEGADELRARLGVTLGELASIPSGEVTFAVVQTAPREVAVVGLLDYGESGEVVDDLLEKAEDALEENGSTRSEEPFEGTDLVVWTGPETDDEDFDEFDDAPADKEEPFKFGYFLKDTHLVLASDPTALEAVLVRWDGTHSDTFADDETFSYIAARTRTDDRDPALLWYANVYDSIRAAVNGANAGMGGSMALAYLPIVGVDQWKAVGGSMDLATDEYQSVGKVVFYADSADKVLGLLKFTPAPVDPPAWVAADAGGHLALNWDLQAAYESARSLYDGIVGPGEFDLKVRELEDAPNGPGLNLKTDVLDQFSGKIRVVTYGVQDAAALLEGGSDAAAAAGQKFVADLGLTDPAKVRDLLQKGVAAAGGNVETREFNGATVYEATNPANGQTFALAVSGEDLLLSADVESLEAALRGPADDPLAEAPAFERAAAKVTGPVSIFSFSNGTDQAETFYELARSGALNDKFGDGEGADVLRDLVDALPPFEAVRPYLSVSASFFEPDEHGAVLTSYAVDAPEEDCPAAPPADQRASVPDPARVRDAFCSPLPARSASSGRRRRSRRRPRCPDPRGPGSLRSPAGARAPGWYSVGHAEPLAPPRPVPPAAGPRCAAPAARRPPPCC